VWRNRVLKQAEKVACTFRMVALGLLHHY
jgi:hypothetical protein